MSTKNRLGIAEAAIILALAGHPEESVGRSYYRQQIDAAMRPQSLVAARVHGADAIAALRWKVQAQAYRFRSRA